MKIKNFQIKKQNISRILIGSNNKGKIKEIRDLIPNKVKILSTGDFNFKSPKENGKTFAENSFIKAKYYSKKTNMVCIADDSGIEIDILNKAPGNYSARWGGKKGNFNLAMNKVYNELSKKSKNWQNKKIKARFVCALTIFWSSSKFITVTGKVEGSISKKKLGKNGFGYDPIFIPNGYKITYGQMKYSKKIKKDHRFKAFRKIRKFF